MKSIFQKVSKTIVTDTPKVLLLYCTYNDFNADSLTQNIQQNYSNFETYILDDSTDANYLKEIDEYCLQNPNIKLIRRENRIGFKAGNLNNLLKREELEYDYFVILDSDEIIPNDFINKALKYFTYYKNIGILQANHIATRNRNNFMNTFFLGINSHWSTYQTLKHFYGFSSLLGHGAMIKKETYDSSGGFPHMVAEDIALSIEARRQNWLVGFAPDIICQEEYPIDYLAFKKRHNKWTQGNLEFIKKQNKKIMHSNFKWFEKLDIILFTYNLPLTFVFFSFILINMVILPLLHVNLTTSWILLGVTILFLFSPMLNDFVCYLFKINIFKFILYVIFGFGLYGSMLFVSLKSSIMGIFGKKAKFTVTPKVSSKIGLWTIIKSQWQELLFAVILGTVSFFTTHSIWPVFLVILSVFLSLFTIIFSNWNWIKINKNEFNSGLYYLNDDDKTKIYNWISSDITKQKGKNVNEKNNNK